MKRTIAFLLAVLVAISLASCSVTGGDEVKKNDYVLSEEVEKGSIVNGVMTELSGSDPILQKTTASWLDTCVLYEVNIRQYTEEGTFAAFEEHLDRLREMGVNTLWLMPIHPISETGRKGTLGSYYAVSDYMDVNPEFGTMDDFIHLVEKAHSMGFKVVLDWVANHTGWDHAWITEHEDWYVHNKSGEIDSPYDWTDTAQLDYENAAMRAEMIKSMQYWVEDIGIDGFRCDHAIGIPATFWNAAVYRLKSVNSEIMMLAEASVTESLTCYAFDSCYNDALYGQASMIRGGVGTSTIRQGMELSSHYVPGSFPMNYLDNHDKNSYEGSIATRLAEAYPALLALCYLTPGMPLLYTSDEEGYDHELEFFEKDTVVWDDEPRYAALISALSALKEKNEALASTNQDLAFIETDNSKLFAFSRTKDDHTVIYIANLFYEAIQDAGAELAFENATCVMHHDGAALDTQKAQMTAQDFANKAYQPYEFYVLTLDAA